MTLYFAPAFFAHLLGKSLQREGAVAKMLAVAKLGTVVLATFVLLWWPFLRKPSTAMKVRLIFLK
jgi:alpha-1,3-glucosyltransferase